MNQSDAEKREVFWKMWTSIYPDKDKPLGFETVMQTSKGESAPPGVMHMTVANPLTVTQQAHTASNEVQQLAYQNAFTAVERLTETVRARDKTIEELQKDKEYIRDANIAWAQGAREQNEEISKLQDQNDDLRLEFSSAKKGVDDADDAARKYERRALHAEAKVRLCITFHNDLLEIRKDYDHSKKLATDSKGALTAIDINLNETIRILTGM